MCVSLIPRVALIGALVLLGGVADAQPAPGASGRTDIASYGRSPNGIAPVPALAVGGDPLFWNNGTQDNITAHLSQRPSVARDDFGTFLAADDFFIKNDFWACIDRVTVCFAVSDAIDGVMTKPTFGLTAFDDCSGRPGAEVYAVTDPELINATLIGPSTFAGFNLWQVTFEINQFAPGYGRYWLSAWGAGDMQQAQYYWLSANNGVIQGAQAQLKNGDEPWADVSECDCPGICTDLCFTIEGAQCCTVLDNTPFDPGAGAKSLQLKGATIDTARAVDNFQIPGDRPQALCALAAWVATNCPTDKLFLEIYENNCNMPGAKLFTIEPGEPADAEDSGMLFNGVPIRRLFWKLDGPVLQPGRDYWLSVVARGTGSILDKAYWMLKADDACALEITQGKVKDPYIAGLEDFTFVSEATNGPARDFAFTLWTHAAASVPPVTGACCFQTACVDLTGDDCAAALGEFFAGQACATSPCPPPPPLTGACCLSGTGCVELSANDCAAQLGIYVGDGTTCADPGCGQTLGACCLPDHAKAVTGCIDDMAQFDCETLQGIFAGLDTTCASNPCDAYYGACCLGNDCFEDTFETVCIQSLGGSFYAQTTCADACPPLGACCVADGTCVDLAEGDCNGLLGAFFLGDACAIHNCPQPLGACCLPPGTCSDASETDCSILGGTFNAGEACATFSCPAPTGACCAVGVCTEVTGAECATMGGAFQPGQSCSSVSCPGAVGACCLPSGACTDATEANCASLSGMWHEGVDCTGFSCPQVTGACCMGGHCTDMVQSACASVGGAFHTSTCASFSCPQPLSACCLSPTVCIDLDQATCSALRGTYNYGKVCASISCSSGVTKANALR